MPASDLVLLSRLQFAFTVSFHIVFPTMSIGLAMFLAIIEGLWLKTGKELYLRIFKFWSLIFSLSFGMGVVSGIVLSYEFGTNFAKFAQQAGPVIGPLIGLEVVTAFFLEAGFLGVMLFGQTRVGPRLHYFATVMVALGTTISASWILSANSWMQTPAGFAIEQGRFVVTDWWQVIFNPSFPYRVAHMLLAAYLSGAFLVAGISSWYLLKSTHQDVARKCLSAAMNIAIVAVIAQFIFGGLLVDHISSHYQPSKNQAFEGHWETRARAPWLILIWPDQAHQRNRFELGIPLLGSLMNEGDINKPVPGLRETPRNRQPPMGIVFYSFRLMFFIELAMVIATVVGLWLRLRGRLYDSRPFHRLCVGMSVSGFLATLGGWITAECGRQPYTVYGQLLTVDSVSPVSPRSVLTTLILFVLVYGVLLSAFLAVLFKVIRKGPAEGPHQIQATGGVRRTFIPDPEAVLKGDIGAGPSTQASLQSSQL